MSESQGEPTGGDEPPSRFSFTEAEEQFRTECREYLESEIRPHVWEWEDAAHAEGGIQWDLVKALADGGFMGLTYPEAVGGSDVSWFRYAIALEELGRVGGSSSFLVHMQNTYPQIIDDEAVVRGIVEGEEMLAFAESEVQSGGDAAAIETVAEPDGDGYRLTGEKTFVSLVPGSTYILITALTDPEAGGKRGMSMFLVPADRDGVTTEMIPEPGLKGHMFGDISLEDVWVDEDELVGEENKGFYQMRDRWDLTRSLGPSAHIGNVLEALDYTVEHAKQKHTFGKPLLKWQDIQFRLVDHYAKVDALRLLAYKGAAMADRGERVTEIASQLKVQVSDVTQDALYDCIEIFGGRAYDEDHEVYRRYVDDLGYRLAGGGVGIHKIILGVERFGSEYAAHKD